LVYARGTGIPVLSDTRQSYFGTYRILQPAIECTGTRIYILGIFYCFRYQNAIVPFPYLATRYLHRISYTGNHAAFGDHVENGGIWSDQTATSYRAKRSRNM